MTEAAWDVLKAFNALSSAEQQQVAAEILSRTNIPEEPPQAALGESKSDESEFTDEQLRAALRGVGRDARQAAFAAGRPVFIVKGTALVALHADGTEEIIKSLRPATEAGQKQE
jgi:hypothetical protein